MFVEIEERVRNGRCIGLVFGIMVWFQVWMSEGFFHGDPFHGIESKEFVQEVQCEGIGVGEHRAEGDFAADGESFEVFSCAAGADGQVIVHGWCSENIQYQS